MLRIFRCSGAVGSAVTTYKDKIEKFPHSDRSPIIIVYACFMALSATDLCKTNCSLLGVNDTDTIGLHIITRYTYSRYRALARMGNVYWRQEKWLEAVKWYDKSLAEHRNPDIVSKKNEVRLQTTTPCLFVQRKTRV